MELVGQWVAAEADEELRRRLPDDALDDRSWRPVAVPGQWQGEPAFATSDGPLLYRHRFDHDPGPERRRHWLTFDGLFYEADVWLDGSYLGDTEGYFAPHTFEVSDHVGARPGPHLLAVELACARPHDRRRKRNLTGVFQHWDAIDPAYNPGGIWAPVRLTSTGPVRLAALRVLCREAGPERAALELEAILEADVARTVTVAAVVTPLAATATTPVTTSAAVATGPVDVRRTGAQIPPGL
jgi:beta-mannosidase